MSEEKHDFLRRWSRLKRESASASPVRKIETEKPVELPALGSLTFESDFKAFMHSKVEQAVKRAALKKLFSDPRFNIMDGLDTYIDDYTKSESIPEEMLARLQHVQQRFTDLAVAEETPAPEESPPPEENPPQQQAPADTAKNDVDPAQDSKAL